MAKQLIKNNSFTHVVYKIWNPTGADVTETIVLADLVNGTSLALKGDTQTVTIKSMAWSGPLGSNLKIGRLARTPLPAISIMEAAPENSIKFDFAEEGFVDNVGATQDLTFTLTAGVYMYISLRLVDGYQTKIQTAELGSYDNPNVVDPVPPV